MRGNLLGGRNQQCISCRPATMCGLTFPPHRTSSSPPPYCILIYAPSPSECSPNSRDPLFVSSQHPRGLLGSGLSTFQGSIHLSLNTLSRRACNGDSVNTTCQLPDSATFSLTLTVHDQGSCMHGGPEPTRTLAGSSTMRNLRPKGDLRTHSFRVLERAPLKKCLKSLEESESFLADTVSVRQRENREGKVAKS